MLLGQFIKCVSITWFAAIGHAQSRVSQHTLCQTSDIFVPLLNQNGTSEASGVLVSDPIPAGIEETCQTRLIFNDTVQINFTLMKVIVWNETQSPERSGYGWKTVRRQGKRQLIWDQIKGIDKSWRNGSSESCPYLYIKGASTSMVPLVNRSQGFLTSIVEIGLDSVPGSTWCNLTLQYTASVPTEDRCQQAGSFRCVSSARCLGTSQRCDGRADCNDGDDEAECYDATRGFRHWSILVPVLAVTTVVIVTTVAAVLRCRSKRSGEPSRTTQEDFTAHSPIKPTPADSRLSKHAVMPMAEYPADAADTRTSTTNEPLYYTLDPKCRLN